MRYVFLILFLAGCGDPGKGSSFFDKEAARKVGDTMACDFNRRHVCVCVWKDSWYTASGLAIDPTGASCQ